MSVLLDSGRLSALWTFCGEFMLFKSILPSEFQLLQMVTFQSATHPSLFQRLSRPEELFKLKEVKINFSSVASSQHLEFSRGNASFLTLWRWRGGGGGNTGRGGMSRVLLKPKDGAPRAKGMDRKLPSGKLPITLKPGRDEETQGKSKSQIFKCVGKRTLRGWEVFST